MRQLELAYDLTGYRLVFPDNAFRTQIAYELDLRCARALRAAIGEIDDLALEGPSMAL